LKAALDPLALAQPPSLPGACVHDLKGPYSKYRALVTFLKLLAFNPHLDHLPSGQV